MVLLATLVTCIAADRNCRSGINTTIFGFPLRFWDESFRCSTTSPQSCFIGELEFDVDFQNENRKCQYYACNDITSSLYA